MIAAADCASVPVLDPARPLDYVVKMLRLIAPDLTVTFATDGVLVRGVEPAPCTGVYWESVTHHVELAAKINRRRK